MKIVARLKKIAIGACVLACTVAMAGCQTTPNTPNTPNSQANPADQKVAKKLVVGFAQVGVEGGWRNAETESVKNSAKELGIELDYVDCEQNAENQVKALKRFVAKKVDAIAFAPIIETGWDEVLKEAKDAKIPVFFVDRMAKVDESLYTAFIGSDFTLEGKNACIEMAKLLNNKGNIVELQGAKGADPAIKRQKGFADELKNYPDMKIIKSETGEWTRAKAKELMTKWLATDKKNINAVFAHNDDMALGAVDAIEAAGLKPSKDIKIVSIDGVKSIFEAMAAGKTNVTVECNPLLGPQMYEAIKTVTSGGTVDKWIKSNEGIYRQDTAKDDLPNRKY